MNTTLDPSVLDLFDRWRAADLTGEAHWVWYTLVTPDNELAAQCREWRPDLDAQVTHEPPWLFCLRCGWHRNAHRQPCEGCGRPVQRVDLHTVGWDTVVEVCAACCPDCD